MSKWIDKIRRIRTSSFAQNTGWMVSGLGSNALLQAATFVLLARLLGVTEYGVFAGAFALVNTVTPYSSLGSAMIFMRYVSADRAAAQTYWGNMFLITGVTTLIFVAGLGVAGSKLLGSGVVGLVIALVISNCFLSQITINASTVFQTFEHLHVTAWLLPLSNLLRLLAIGALLITLHHATAFQYSLAILVSSGIAAACAAVLVQSRIGRMRVSIHLLFQRFWEGIGFSFAGTTQAVYNDIDKTMLSHYGMNAANGLYTFAYRIVDLSTIPVSSIDAACLPRYFSLNKESLSAVTRLAKRIVPVGALCGLCAALVTLLASPFFVRLVGHGFAGALPILRWLCWLPAIRGIHQLAGGVLTATGLQNYRTAAQFVVAAMNFGMNLVWIPAHGWLGAAWASLLSDGALAVLNALLIFYVAVRAGRTAEEAVSEEHAQ